MTATTRSPSTPADLTDLRRRLDNWSRWVRDGRSSGMTTMTGIVCDRMRDAALGKVWSGHDVKVEMDNADAELIERAMRRVLPRSRKLLELLYVKNMPVPVICARLGVRKRPASEFDLARVQAELDLQQGLEAGERSA